MSEKFVGEPFCVSKKFWYRKFSRIGGVGYHGFVEIFLCHRTETKSVVKEHFCVSENIWHGKKFYGSEGMGLGGVSRLPSKICWLTVSKTFVGKTFCVLKGFWYGKKFRDLRRGIRIFRRNILSHIVGKIRRGDLLCFKKNLASKIFKQKRVGVMVRIRGWVSRFCRNFFVSQCRKNLYGKFLVWKKSFWVRRNGGGQQVRRKFRLTGPKRTTS